MRSHKDRLGNKHTILDDSDMSTLANICRAAAERFKETATGFRKLIDYQPKPHQPGDTEIDMTPHGDGARRIAEQFDRQAAEASAFAALFNDSDHAEVINPPEDDEEEEAA